MNNKNTLPVLSIPRTEMIKGAHANGGTVYIVQLEDQRNLWQIYLAP